jgi:hypothetical protein
MTYPYCFDCYIENGISRMHNDVDEESRVICVPTCGEWGHAMQLFLQAATSDSRLRA